MEDCPQAQPVLLLPPSGFTTSECKKNPHCTKEGYKHMHHHLLHKSSTRRVNKTAELSDEEDSSPAEGKVNLTPQRVSQNTSVALSAASGTEEPEGDRGSPCPLKSRIHRQTFGGRFVRTSGTAAATMPAVLGQEWKEDGEFQKS
jgi:hypothetical protein